MAQDYVCAHHPILMVIHDERLSVCSLSVPRFVPFRVSLLHLVLVFPLLPVLCPKPILPSGQRQGKHTLRLRQTRSLVPWQNSLLPQITAKRFWTSIFYVCFTQRLSPKNFYLTTCKETEKKPLKLEGRRLFAQVKTDKIKAQFQCRHLQHSRSLRVPHYWWNYRRTTWSDSKEESKCRNCNSTNFSIHNRFWCGKFASKPNTQWTIPRF